ncbi:binding-protein-dependent transport systems inner membrane component [Novosphingobium nitrogenifigens DSM 19370]|uniref:Binding-protein-dependent transport systems inner membrane component n=1 Tax=Novosphingobium nitrogenifigens DSM 19370 TaxID=983920 RepID=F1ZAQ3_9SPHN|nr:ABC transporter permease subunit [Novosphingobium nitrogenifigens]EGD58310.1 binding-protein-dependent transport systems inner membrane component [Novosphingobium nitrogenifigens DSM 19370]
MTPDRHSARPLPAFSRMLRLTRPSREDAIAFVILGGLAAIFFRTAEATVAPLSTLQLEPLTLDPSYLPYYALRTVLRMFVALFASTVFTLVVATLAARSRHLGQLIVPALDILQSVPILGFLTFTVTFFMGLFPGSVLGVECASIFAILTSQAWNMAFSFYQSLRAIPSDLEEATVIYRLSPIRRFLKLDLPFATPALVWNAMMSMSGGWFFVVASEAITVGKTTVTLPGIGSWLALAIGRRDFLAVGEAVAAMALVIVAYDQLFFRPIVAWADRFRFEMTASAERPRSWVFDLLRRTRLLPVVLAPLGAIGRLLLAFEPRVGRRKAIGPARSYPLLEKVWQALVIVAATAALVLLSRYIMRSLMWGDVLTAVLLAGLTMIRVMVLIALASLVWVPVGVWIGLRPVWAERLQPLAQFLAAFPANVLFPFAVMAIVRFDLAPDVWLSPLMILGTQWYILFNVIAGASAIPTDLREAAWMFRVRGWQWWRQVALPGIFPYYVTGALTASGGSWNASIVAEAVDWGNRHLVARGLGSFIAEATTAGDYPRVALGIGVMSLFVLGFNRLLWRPLYAYADRRLRLS